MSLSLVLRTTMVAVGLSMVAAAAQADTVFDARTGGQGSFTQCFVCSGGNPTISELGDIVTLGGTARQVNAATVRLAQRTLTGPDAYSATVTLSLYSVNTTTLATSMIGNSSSLLQVPATGYYDVSFSFASLTVPTTLYYGISISSTSTDARGLELALWDYWSAGSGGDGALPVGMDPGTVFNGPTDVTSINYGRLVAGGPLVASTSNGLGLNQLSNGFTPSIQISAVPEPGTYGMMTLGLVAMGAVLRRRKQA